MKPQFFSAVKKNVRLYFSLNQKSLLYKLFLLSFCTTCIEGIFDLGQNKDVHFFYDQNFARFYCAQSNFSHTFFQKCKDFVIFHEISNTLWYLSPEKHQSNNLKPILKLVLNEYFCPINVYGVLKCVIQDSDLFVCLLVHLDKRYKRK